MTNSKILTLYFSKTGNTRAIAEMIHGNVGGDVLELKTAHAYPEEYRATTEQARKELDSNFRPQLTTKLDTINEYDIIFLGYPNWWGTMPTAYFSLFDQYDFAGKTIIPFSTHEGSGLGRGPSDIAKYCPNTTVSEGMAVRGKSVNNAETAVKNWLNKLQITG